MIKDKKNKLIICTTVPDTLLYILKGQPKYLSNYFEVIVITGRSKKNATFINNENIKLYEIYIKRNINIFFDFISLIQMIIILIRLKPLIVHSYTPKAGLITMISSWIIRIPIRIHTFTGLIFPSQIGIYKKLLVFIDKLICFCATKIIPEGLGVKNDLISNGITSKRLEIIGNGNIAGIDTSFFSDTLFTYKEALNRLGFSESILKEKFVYCFIGRLNVDKGLKELYEAFITLPTQAFLLIAGDLDTDGKSISSELLLKLRNNPRIIFLGFIEDVRLVLKISNVLVLPSYREGFPNVLLQSLSMKVPAIASNINGCNEIISNHKNGWLVEPHNYRDLADKMLFSSEIDYNSFDKIKEYARESIINRFEQSTYRISLLNEYYSLSKSYLK